MFISGPKNEDFFTRWPAILPLRDLMQIWFTIVIPAPQRHFSLPSGSCVTPNTRSSSEHKHVLFSGSRVCSSAGLSMHRLLHPPLSVSEHGDTPETTNQRPLKSVSDKLQIARKYSAKYSNLPLSGYLTQMTPCLIYPAMTPCR